MTGIELFVVSVLRALVEVALLALLGQGVVALLAGTRRGSNPIYRLFQIITAPVLNGLRRITPRLILDKHLPLVAFFVLFWLWILLAYVKRVLCGIDGLACGG
jgi:uncharacterized protein YggT (Ycf19 family)